MINRCILPNNMTLHKEVISDKIYIYIICQNDLRCEKCPNKNIHIGSSIVIDGRTATVSSVCAGCWIHGSDFLALKGCGLGSLLMLLSELVAIEEGCTKIELDDMTIKDPMRGNGFYEYLGYERLNTGEPEMEKQLSNIDTRRKIQKIIYTKLSPHTALKRI